MHDILILPLAASSWREYSIRQAAVNKPMVPLATSMHAVVKILARFCASVAVTTGKTVTGGRPSLPTASAQSGLLM